MVFYLAPFEVFDNYMVNEHFYRSKRNGYGMYNRPLASSVASGYVSV